MAPRSVRVLRAQAGLAPRTACACSVSTERSVEHTPNQLIKCHYPQQKRAGEEDEGPVMEHLEVIINFLLEPSHTTIHKTI